MKTLTYEQLNEQVLCCFTESAALGTNTHYISLCTTNKIKTMCMVYPLKHLQGAYKFGKMKFPEFSRFSKPFRQLFPDNYKEKP